MNIENEYYKMIEEEYEKYIYCDGEYRFYSDFIELIDLDLCKQLQKKYKNTKYNCYFEENISDPKTAWIYFSLKNKPINPEKTLIELRLRKIEKLID